MPPLPLRYVRRRFRAPTDRVEEIVAELWLDRPLGLELLDGVVDAYWAIENAPPQTAVHPDVELLGEELIGDDDWLEGWRSAAAPFALGERFWVDPGEGTAVTEGPSQHSAGPRIALRLPARRAFGTGSHATTRLAVSWLEQTPLQGRDVLDVGAGTGVLAFVCRCLGARRVFAVERELESVLLAGANQRLNRLDVCLVGGTAAALGPLEVDVIAANLLSAHLAPELPGLIDRLTRDGIFVYAGALRSERRDVIALFRASGLLPRGEKVEGEWSAWLFQREGAR
jgi:ribosomal protein L11 methyltransferase